VSRPLRHLIKKAVRVVAPAAVGAPGGTCVGRVGLGPEAPVLGHRPGIDRAEYGSSDFAACRDEANFSIDVAGRTRKVFFLCGHPRSGTHWMDGVFRLHPHIHISGEYRFESLHNSLNDLTGHGWHACSREPMRSLALSSFRRTIREVVGSSAAFKPETIWVGDRTPRPVRVFLPGAPHILILRDPRDILVSLTHQELKNGGFNYTDGGFDAELGPVRERFLTDPDLFKREPGLLLGNERWVRRLAHRWRRHAQVDLRCLKRIDEAAAGPGADGPGPIGDSPAWNWQARVFVIRYEQIHADPEVMRQKLYNFLGVDPSLAGPLSESSRTKPVLANENPHAVFRKGAVGDWKIYFNADTERWFRDEAGDTLAELGYEW
jgi:Sulfotransferase domain